MIPLSGPSEMWSTRLPKTGLYFVTRKKSLYNEWDLLAVLRRVQRKLAVMLINT